MRLHRRLEGTELQPAECRLPEHAAKWDLRTWNLRGRAEPARLQVHLRAGLAELKRNASLHRRCRRVPRKSAALLEGSQSDVHQHARQVCVRAVPRRLYRKRLLVRGRRWVRSQQRRMQFVAESRLHQLEGEFNNPNWSFDNIKSNFVPWRVRLDAAIARLVTMETEKHARRAPYAPISNVPIAVSATKTPSAFNIPTATRCVSVGRATAETASDRTDVLSFLWTLAPPCGVKTAEPALSTQPQMGRRVNARRAPCSRCAIALTTRAAPVHVSMEATAQLWGWPGAIAAPARAASVEIIARTKLGGAAELETPKMEPFATRKIRPRFTSTTPGARGWSKQITPKYWT